MRPPTLLAVLLPPAAVFVRAGHRLGGVFWLNVVLTVCGYLPGVLHALWYAKR